jgi:hypothetical protein
MAHQSALGCTGAGGRIAVIARGGDLGQILLNRKADRAALKAQTDNGNLGKDMA